MFVNVFILVMLLDKLKTFKHVRQAGKEAFLVF